MTENETETTAEAGTPPKKKRRKKRIPLPTLEIELEVGFPLQLVVGVDEVGRGCLAGPVVAGAVLLPEAWGASPLKDLRKAHKPLQSITDSKLVPSEHRPELAKWIQENVRGWGIGWASVEEIDTLNIFHASFLAMKRAIAELETRLGAKAQHILVDGSHTHADWRGSSTAVVKGDLRCLSISCAAIIAKVHRDDWMRKLGSEIPGYGFEVHKGYATPMHYKQVQEKGPCAIHRRSFSPVREMLEAEIVAAQNEFSF